MESEKSPASWSPPPSVREFPAAAVCFPLCPGALLSLWAKRVKDRPSPTARSPNSAPIGSGCTTSHGSPSPSSFLPTLPAAHDRRTPITASNPTALRSPATPLPPATNHRPTAPRWPPTAPLRLPGPAHPSLPGSSAPNPNPSSNPAQGCVVCS